MSTWSICQPSICLSWLPALAVAGPRAVRAFKEGEKMKSNLQSASPKEVRVPAERTKEAASFLRQDQDCIDPVAASQCSHLSVQVSRVIISPSQTDLYHRLSASHRLKLETRIKFNFFRLKKV